MGIVRMKLQYFSCSGVMKWLKVKGIPLADGADLGFSNAKLIQLIKGDIDAVALSSILTHIPQDVGDLIGGAQSKGRGVHRLEWSLYLAKPSQMSSFEG